jgi:serine protease
VNYLFEGSLMIGTGPTTVSDGARTTGSAQDDDFQTTPGGIPKVQEPAPPYDEAARATFTDALAATPLGLLVEQQSIEMAAPPNDDFIVLRYNIRNTSAGTLNSVRIGWFCDWDIDGGHFETNVTGYDAGRGLMHAHDTSGSGPTDYVGVITLSAPGTTAARGIVNDQDVAPDWGVYDAYTEQEKWETLSVGPIHTAVGPQDVSIGLGTGPFDIPAGGSIAVAFAFLGGTNLADLQANADAAIAFYGTLPTDTGDPVHDAAPRAIRLAQNAPNPFNPTTTIDFDLPRATHVSLAVYAVDGRLVRSLVDEVRPAGRHQAAWDGRDNAGNAMASGTYLYRFEADGRSLARKMQLLK